MALARQSQDTTALPPKRLRPLLAAATLLSAATLVTVIPARANDTDKQFNKSIFSGTDFSKGSFSYSVGGALTATESNPLSGMFVDFVYAKGEFGDLIEDGSEGVDSRIDVKIGYQKTIGHFGLAAAVGYEHRKISLTPFDPTNLVQGSKSGAVFSANISTTDDIPLHFSVNAQYATVFDSYDASMRLGINFNPKLTIGAEGSTGATEGDDSQRLGAFISLKFDVDSTTSGELSGYFGKQFVKGETDATVGISPEGSGGNYGGLGLSFSF